MRVAIIRIDVGVNPTWVVPILLAIKEIAFWLFQMIIKLQQRTF